MGYTYTGEMVDLGHGRGWLSRPAAASIKRIDAQIRHALQITEAGRSFFRQQQHWEKYLRDGYPIALNPNTPSEHQKGLSIDSDEAQNILGIMEDHGWRRTVYRWVNGKWTLVERWHFEYFAHLDNHIHESAPGGAASLIPQEDAMPQSVRAPSGKIYGIDTGSIVHYKRQSQAKVTTAVNDPGPGDGETHNLTLAQFVDYLDGMQIPRSVLDVHGNVWNPEANNLNGAFEEGGAWSWARENRASSLRIERALKAAAEAKAPTK